MTDTYKKGQKVSIEPAKNQQLSARDSALELYRGKIGKIVDAYWINMGTNARTFYLYSVRIDNEGKEIVVHEDEIKALLE